MSVRVLGLLGFQVRKRKRNRKFIVKDKRTIRMVTHPYTPYTEEMLPE